MDTLLLILHACPEISADWLLLGRGEMLRSESGTSTWEFSQAIKVRKTVLRNDPDITNRFLSALEEKDRQIERLIDLLAKE